MILKERISTAANSATAKAGQKQEQDVAFFLRRHFKEHENVFVFNDLKFKYNDETAQIDHLILYPFGFILIESKSITGEVSVNKEEEWSRSYNGQWRGMASPIKQVELQQKLLKDLLHHHREQILGTILFKQQSFRFRSWDNLCAISSNAIIDRIGIPKDISAQLAKSEFLADKVNELMKIKNSLLSIINPLDTRPAFSTEEMKSIADFLLANDYSSGECLTNSSVVEPTTQTQQPWKAPTQEAKQVQSVTENNSSVSSEPDSPQKNIVMMCAKCSTTNQLEAKPGKFGYYVKCNSCDSNTPLKRPCPKCQSKKTKVSKKKDSYTLICQDCADKTPIAINETTVLDSV